MVGTYFHSKGVKNAKICQKLTINGSELPDIQQIRDLKTNKSFLLNVVEIRLLQAALRCHILSQLR